MFLAHKIELVANRSQHIQLVKCCGVARFAYNWALAEWNRQWVVQKELPTEERKFISEMALRRQFNAIKKAEFPFTLEVSKYCPQEAIRQLGDAFKRFFKGQNKYPTFRKKFKDDRFTIGNDHIKVEGKRVHLPKIGWMRMREEIRFHGKIKSVSVSRWADRWLISFNVECDDHTAYFEQKTENQGEVGAIDASLESLAVLHNGERFSNPRALRKNEKKLRRMQRSLARRKKGSNRRKMIKGKIARLHKRIKSIRHDAIHKLTTKLVETYGVICIETLNIKGLMKNKHLSKSFADAALGEMKRQLLYKAKLRGVKIVEAPRFFPSSKLCSCCGWKKENLKLSTRQWTCVSCGANHDRDVNAAQNLRNYAVSCTV